MLMLVLNIGVKRVNYSQLLHELLISYFIVSLKLSLWGKSFLIFSRKTEPKKYISLPYVPGTSELLRRIFSTHNIKCSFHSPTTLRRFLSKPKDQVPIEEQNNVIYKIPCGDCQAVYIGETKRSFGTRYKEHFSAVKNGNVAKYEIAEHSWKYDHRIDWDNKTIIDRERFLIARKAKETIHSLADKNHINSISYVLPDIWLPILQQQNWRLEFPARQRDITFASGEQCFRNRPVV